MMLLEHTITPKIESLDQQLSRILFMKSYVYWLIDNNYNIIKIHNYKYLLLESNNECD